MTPNSYTSSFSTRPAHCKATTRLNLCPTQLTILLCTLTLAACAPLPTHDAPPAIKPIGHYASGKSFEAPLAQWPSSSWWTIYGDAQLDTLISEALADSPTIAVAQARLQHAQAIVQTTDAMNAPQVSANTSITEQKQSYN